jgi:hypothetical protein
MEPEDTEMFETPQQKREAKRNAQQIKSNILKLVRIFRQDDMQAKLNREHREVISRPQGNEVFNYLGTFDKTKQLWFTKLSTSLEDFNRMQEQVELSGKRVTELSTQLKTKKENLDKFTKSSKEHKEQRRVEIENLKKAKAELKADKYSMENTLEQKGLAIKESQEKRHQDRM